jgi:hypothetical protein
MAIQKLCLFMSLCILLVVLEGFSAESNDTKTHPNEPSQKAGYHIYSHAHNDYEHERPLLDALDNRFYSVEADIWLVDGEIMVSHDKGKYKGSLKELYLDPLQKRVDDAKSVHGDGEEFDLWIDIKDGREELLVVLHNLLKQYSMITTFADEKITHKQVMVILTGNDKSKRNYVDKFDLRYACRDSNGYDPDDPDADHKWIYYALPWRQYIRWYGDEPILPEEKEKLIKLVNDIHQKGRGVRFYAAPDNENYWKLALETGINYVNTDKLAELNEFLENYK